MNASAKDFGTLVEIVTLGSADLRSRDAGKVKSDTVVSMLANKMSPKDTPVHYPAQAARSWE